MTLRGIVTMLMIVTWLAADMSAWPATYYVSPTGADGNPGTLTQPFATIARAAEVVRQPGDLVLIANGTYPEAVFVHGAGTAGQPITFRAQGSQAVITGHVRPLTWPGDDAIGGAHAHPWVTWDGFKLRGTRNTFQLRMATGWRAVSNVFEFGANGINARGDQVILANNTFRDLGCHAYVIYGSQAPTVTGNQVRRINAGGQCDPAASAVSKIGYTTGLRITHNIFADNKGPAVWLDFENRDYRITDNDVFRSTGRTAAWQGAGIQTEINAGPGVIQGNTVTGCSGPGINILESAEVDVRDNTISGGYAGIELRNLARGPRISAVHLEGNTIRSLVPVSGVRSAGVKFAVGDPAPGAVTSFGNTIEVSPQPLYDWFNVKVFTEAEACAQLGFECQ